MDKKFAIFDMDGTLVDSMGYWRRLWEEYLSAKGVDPVPEDIGQRIKALNMTESAQLFIKEFSIDGTPQSVAREMNDLMGEHYKNHISLKPGVRDYLEGLKKRGVRMCVATATAEYLVRSSLEHYGIADYFDFVISCEETGLGKHRPDIYYIAAGRYGVRPQEAAVYEDAFYAARTAKTAGFYLIGVHDDYAARHWREICAMSDELVVSWRQKAAELALKA